MMLFDDSSLTDQQAQLEFLHKFTKISCEASDKKTCENTYCYITTTDTSLSLASYDCTLTRPLKSLNVSLIEIHLKTYLIFVHEIVYYARILQIW